LLFTDDPRLLPLMGVLNSRLCNYLLRALNPTVSVQAGDVRRLPVPKNPTVQITARARSKESEIAYEFIAPPRSTETVNERERQLRLIGEKIDEEVSRIYGLDDGDLAEIDQELSSPLSTEIGEEDEQDKEEIETPGDFTSQSTAISWPSYAFGVVLGRFEIGKAGGLGCGDFPSEVHAAVAKLTDCDGVITSDANHPQDIVKRILTCLEVLLGRVEAHATIRSATENEGDPEDILRDWIDRQFWKYHFQLYRKRAVYWPLQSPKKRFTVWIFHERFTKDTLFHIRRNIADVRLRLLEREIADKRKEAATNKAAAKQVDKLRDLEDDLREFSKRLKDVADRGYTPHIDDGVLLNAAPLYSLLPNWPETKKVWQELEAGEYDWAQQAMEYWPDRVKEKCKTNKSFAIAHGLA
jgi:hypothetical protein